MVAVEQGDVEGALKRIKKFLMFTGATRAIRAGGKKFGGFVGPAERRRLKSRAARTRARKQDKRQNQAMAGISAREGDTTD